MSYDPSKAPLISETLLKSRRSLDELAYRRSVNQQSQNKRPRVVRGEDVKIKRPEQFVRERMIKQGSQNKMKRRQREVEQRTKGPPKVHKSSIKKTVGFAVRIHQGRHASDEIKLSLRKLGLRAKYDGIFVKLDEAGISSLLPLSAYVAFGYLSKKSVEELVHRRAFTEHGGVRSPLSDNVAVEKKLGNKGILCLNDMAHEIYGIGEHFDAASGMLAPFKLSAPVGAYEKKLLDITDEVENKGGFLGDEMDKFLAKIL